MAILKMALEMREAEGKNKVDKLRNENYIPAVMYSKGEEPVSVMVEMKEFQKVYKTAGTSTMISLQLDGKSHNAIIKDVQKHPFKNIIMHVDFQKLDMNEKVKMTVPVILHGRDSIRLQPSILIQVLDNIDIECLPADIPANGGEVNVEDMTFDTPILVKDLDLALDGKVTILTDLNEPVAVLQEPAEYKEEEEVDSDEPQEVEVINEKKKEE